MRRANYLGKDVQGLSQYSNEGSESCAMHKNAKRKRNKIKPKNKSMCRICGKFVAVKMFICCISQNMVVLSPIALNSLCTWEFSTKAINGCLVWSLLCFSGASNRQTGHDNKSPFLHWCSGVSDQLSQLVQKIPQNGTGDCHGDLQEAGNHLWHPLSMRQ